MCHALTRGSRNWILSAGFISQLLLQIRQVTTALKGTNWGVFEPSWHLEVQIWGKGKSKLTFMRCTPRKIFVAKNPSITSQTEANTCGGANPWWADTLEKWAESRKKGEELWEKGAEPCRAGRVEAGCVDTTVCLTLQQWRYSASVDSLYTKELPTFCCLQLPGIIFFVNYIFYFCEVKFSETVHICTKKNILIDSGTIITFL